jgi:hypothetical protein
MSQGQSRFDEFPTYVRSGQLQGLASGTVYSFPDVPCTSILIIPHPSNAGNAWIGNSTGTVGGNTGYPLNNTTKNPIIFSGVSNLNYIKASFDVANDKVCWIVESLE